VWSWVLASVFVALAVGAGWWVTHSAIFQARNLSVSGNHRLTDEQVFRLGGVSRRTNVMWFSPGAVEAALQASPWIASARVARTLPSTISITVFELSALAVLDTGSHRYLLALDGTVLGPAARNASLPVIRFGRGPLRTGVRIAVVRSELEVIAALPKSVRPRVVRMETVPGQGLVLVLTGGIDALYGDAGDAEAKGQALKAILDWAQRGGVRLATVDVRIPATPVASPVAPEPTPSVAATRSAPPSPSPSATR
jgi:cell division protein FtsQ